MILKVKRIILFAGSKEWSIEHCEDFGDLKIAKHEDLNVVHGKANFIRQYGAVGAALAVSYYNSDLTLAKKTLTDRYHGEHESALDFASDLFDE